MLDSLGNVAGTCQLSHGRCVHADFPASERVILQVEEEGYGFYSEAFEPTESQEPFVSIELKRLEVGTVLVLRDVRFERSSAALDARFQPDLEQLARTMQNAEFRIRIAGHTDGEGSAERNQALSEERALSVARFLEAFGIEGSRLETIGYGMTQPIATNNTEEGRALNRRTEIEIIE